ncbi:MAG: hypothetical protein Q7S36_00535 [Candidatus Liptonbacteria bacterium]|nr:hypothetical protein [Candidatus Liptonbacteria bacterium]
MADYPDEQDDGPLAPLGDEDAIAEADAEADLDLESQVALEPISKPLPNRVARGFSKPQEATRRLVALATAPRSDEVVSENNRNPEGYGPTFWNLFVASDSMYHCGYIFVLAPGASEKLAHIAAG